MQKRCPKCWDWIQLPEDGSSVECPYCQSVVSLSDAPVPLSERIRHGKAAFAGEECFSGRARRSEYWAKAIRLMLVAIFVALPLVVVPIVTTMSNARNSGVEVGSVICIVLGVLIAIVCWVAVLPVTVRRLHDRNMSGWWILWFALLECVPFVGWMAGIVQFVIVGCMDGVPGPNQYGPDPKGRNNFQSQKSTAVESMGPEARIMRLRDMLAKGLITESEFNERRTKIVSEL